MGKTVKEILLGDHFVPVPVHLLPKMGILAFLQLDQSCDLFHQREKPSDVAAHQLPQHTLDPVWSGL